MKKYRKKERDPVFNPGKNKSFISDERPGWGRKHDSQLTKLVQKYKQKNWKQISKEMQEEFNDSELTSKKCRERWFNCTNPNIDKTSLSEYEELFLLVYHYEYKNKWVCISQHLPRRNSSKLKNNFSSLIRRITRKISIDEKEGIISAFEYIQMLYASIIIYDLNGIENSPETAVIIAPIHIYDHVKSKNLTCDQCLKYMIKIGRAHV